MRIQWYGQSAFSINGERTVFVDPFGVMEGLAERGMQFDYPPIETCRQISCSSRTSIATTTPWRWSDDAAGTKRGPNTIFCFTVDGLRLCHFGDFGQAGLRAEQQQAIGQVDVVFLPVGGGPTIDGTASAAIVRALRPRLVVPMHYGTQAVNFLEPPDAFLDVLGARVERLDESCVGAEQVLGTADQPTVALLAVPGCPHASSESG